MDTKFRVECGHCGQAYRLSPDLAGKQVKCKNCGLAFRVAAPGSAPPPIPPPTPTQDDLFAGLDGSSAAPAQDDLFASLGGAPIAPARLPAGTVGGFQQPSMAAGNATAKKKLPMSQRRRPDPATDSDDDGEEEKGTWNQYVGMTIFMLATFYCMWAMGRSGGGARMSISGCYGLMIVCGMVGFGMIEFRYWAPGVIGGVVGGASTIFMHQIMLGILNIIKSKGYVVHGNKMALVFMLAGVLPGFLFYGLGRDVQDSILGKKKS